MEHVTNYCYGRLESSSAAQHPNNTAHNVNIENVELMNDVTSQREEE